MYGLEVRSCNFTLTEDIKNEYGSALNGKVSAYEVTKNNKFLGHFLHIVYSPTHQSYLYFSEVNELPCEERLYLRTLIED